MQILVPVLCISFQNHKTMQRQAKSEIIFFIMAKLEMTKNIHLKIWKDKTNANEVLYEASHEAPLIRKTLLS